MVLISADQKNRARNVIGKVVGIEEGVVNELGIMIVGAETVTGILTVIMDTIENVKERGTDPAAMIQGVVVDHVHDQESELEIMIATGILSSMLDLCSAIIFESSLFPLFFLFGWNIMSQI